MSSHALGGRWAALLLPVLAACPDFVPAPDAKILCTEQSECPTGFTCEAVVGRCVPTVREDTTPPSVVATSIDPPRAGAGDIVTIRLEVDELLDSAPALTVGGQPAELEDSDLAARIITWTHVVPPGAPEDEGQRAVDVELVDVSANVRRTNVGSLSVDYTPPRATVVFTEPTQRTAATGGDILKGLVTTELDTEVASAALVGDGGLVLPVLVGAPTTVGGDLRVPITSSPLDAVALQSTATLKLEVEIVGVRPQNASPRAAYRSTPLAVDLTPPTSPSLSFAEGDITSTESVTAVVFADGASLVCLDGDITGAQGCADVSRFVTIPEDGRVPVTLLDPEGEKTVTATFMDGALARSPPVSASIAFVGDGVVESVPELVLPVGQSAIKEGDVLGVRGTAQAGARVVSARLVDVATDATIVDFGLGTATGILLAPAGTFDGQVTVSGSPVVDAAAALEVALEVVVIVGPQASAAESSRSAPVTVDNVAPLNAAVVVTNGAEVSSTEVQLFLAASGATAMSLGGDLAAGLGVGTFVPFQETVNAFLLPQDGLRTIDATFRDDAHNVSTATTTVTLDRVVPSVSVSIASRHLRPDTGAGVPGVKAGDTADVVIVADRDVTLASASLIFVGVDGAEIPGCTLDVAAQLRLVPSADDQTVVLDPAFDTVRLSTTPCAGAANVALRVLGQSSGGALSDPTASTSATLFVDDTPPSGTASRTLEADALAGFARGLAQQIAVAASDDRGVGPFVRFDGNIADGARVRTFVGLPVDGTEDVQLVDVEGTRIITVTFEDEVENALTFHIALTLDHTPPATPIAASLELRESPPVAGADDPALVDDANNTFTLEGIAGAVLANRALVYRDEPLTQRLSFAGDPTLDVVDGAFAEAALPSSSVTVFVVALDDAGNESAPRTVSVPAFSLISAPARPRNGAPFSFTFVASTGIQGNPTVTVGDASAEASFVSRVSNTFTYQIDLDETDPLLLAREGVARAVVRVRGAAAGFAPQNQGTDAVVATLDFTPPGIDSARVVLEQRAPPLVDRISGLSGALADDAGPDVVAADTVTVEIRSAANALLATRTVDANGAFTNVDLGDDVHASVRVRAIDAAGNTSEIVELNDIADPVIANVAMEPAVLRDGTPSTITFDVTDATGLAAVPTVLVRGRAATHLSGTPGTPGTVAFTYTFTASAVLDTEGAGTTSISVADPSGNASSATTPVTFDFTPPTVVCVDPGTRARWNVNPAASGTSGDGITGVSAVTVALQRVSTGLFLQADNTFSSATAVQLAVTGTSSWSRALDTGAFEENESYALTVRATDGAANVAQIGPFTFVADRIAPNTTITGGPSLFSASTNVSESFTFTCDQEPCTFRCSLDDAPAVACSSPHVVSDLSFGTHTFTVAATDLAGNTDASPASTQWSLRRKFLEISQSENTGRRLVCGVAQDGSLWCWGESVNTIVPSFSTGAIAAAPELVDDTQEWAHVTVGLFHMCMTTVGGDLYCRGDNSNGQLGVGQGLGQGGLNLVSTGGWSQVSAGDMTTCGLRDIGGTNAQLLCWGSNAQGEAGVGNTDKVFVPTPVAAGPSGPTEWIDVDMGSNASGSSACAIGSDGKVYCWGSDGFNNALPDNLAVDQTRPTPMVGATALPATFVDVSQNGGGGCGVAGNGTLWCWGDNSHGQAGQPLATNPVFPATLTTEFSDWVDIERAGSSTCGIHATNRGVCFGSGEFGERRDQQSSSDLATGSPTTNGGSELNVTAVFLGNDTTWFVHADGTTNCTGRNGVGQCGVGAAGRSGTIENVVATNVIAFAAGARSTFAISNTLQVLASGDNESGQLGITVGTRRSSFAASTAGSFTKVTSGSNWTCGIRSDGSAACWGDDSVGQLGAGAGNQSGSTARTAGLVTDDWSTLDAGGATTCGLLSVGTESRLRCWGFRLELSGFQVAEVPTAVTGDSSTQWAAVDVGGSHACGLVADGSNTVRCWGSQNNGVIGNGQNSTNRVQPTVVAPPVGFIWNAVSTGDTHTCGLASDGQIYCWGANNFGQLGTGDTTSTTRTAPTPVGAPAGWLSVAAGGKFTCGTRNNGTGTAIEVHCWGDATTLSIPFSNNAVPEFIGEIAANSLVLDVCNESSSNIGGHVCALGVGGAAANTLSCLGLNDVGQLGDGLGFLLTPSQLPEP